ncbi:MAG: hypothetical protein HY905_23470 [Deltaproteobacteria bacterium]|nr:hypothetical protein [Deltaproteobacteria bacterium]
MKLVCLAWIGLGLVGGAGCKSSGECAKCACDGGGGGAVAQAPVSGEKAKGEPTQPSAHRAPAEPARGALAAAAKCAAGADCETEVEAPPGPGRPIVGSEEPVTGSRPLVPPTGALAPVEVVPSGEPLAPGLAAHLERIPAGDGMMVVVQADVRALLSADQVREAFRSAVALLAGEVPGDLSCAAELLAATELVTVVFFENQGGHESGGVILEGGADLPGVIECAGRIVPSELPDGAAAQAARGYVELDDDFALGTLGPRTIVVGEPALVMEMRAGRVRRPLSASPEFQAAQRVAGAGPVTVVAIAHDERGEEDESFSGGAVLRTSPRLEAVGVFTFASMEMVGELVDDFTEAVGEMDHDRAMILRELSDAPGGPALAGEVVGLLDAAVDARLTIQGSTLSFEVRAPQGATPASLAATAARAVPLLLMGEKHDEEAVTEPPSERAIAVPPIPVEPQQPFE